MPPEILELTDIVARADGGISFRSSVAFGDVIYAFNGQVVSSGIKGRMQDPKAIIASGTVLFPADQWHRLGLKFSRTTIQVIIDDKPVAGIEDATFRSGMAGIGSGWNGSQFDNLSISSGVDVEPRSWTRN